MYARESDSRAYCASRAEERAGAANSAAISGAHSISAGSTKASDYKFKSPARVADTPADSSSTRETSRDIAIKQSPSELDSRGKARSRIYN